MAMQKFIQEHYAALTDIAPFAYETVSSDLDEEVLFKRIRLSVAIVARTLETSQSPLAVRWSLIQADTAITPANTDAVDDNRCIVQGVFSLSAGTGSMEYDHTITMRKLKSSSIYLCLQIMNISGATVSLAAYSSIGLHYLEM